MVDESPTCFATVGRVGPKSAWIENQFEVDCRRQVEKSILNREEVLTDTSPRTSMTRRANMEGLAHAIDNDDVRSSTGLRYEDDPLSYDLRFCRRPRPPRCGSFAGFGACDPTQ
jgi:hypothetical protein